MATITHHIERLKEKPSHIRERIAFGISGGITGLVAIGWLVAMSSSGSFSLATKSVANAVTPSAEVSQSVSQSTSNFSSLMGAAAASFGVGGDAANVKVVDTKTTSTLDTSEATSATVIPF